MPVCSIIAGRRIEEVTILQDCTGAHWGTLNKTGWKMLQRATKLAADNYPEQLGVYLIMNSPTFFPYLWAIVKTFVDEKTRSKVKIFSQD